MAKTALSFMILAKEDSTMNLVDRFESKFDGTS